MKRTLAYAAIYIFWGASFLAIREVVAVTPPFFAAGVRFLLAGLLLFCYVLLRRMPMPSAREWKAILLLGVLFFVFSYGPLFVAEQRVPSGEAAVIAAIIPTFVFVLEAVVLRRISPTWTGLVGAMMGLSGVAWLVLASGPPANVGQLHADRYVLIQLAGTVCWSIATVWSARLALPKLRAVSSSLQMTVGGIGLLIVSVLLGEPHRISSAAFQPRFVWGMLYLVVFASVAAFSAYVYLLSHEPASRVASYAYVNPLVAVALGIWLGGEKFSLWQLAASALVILGTALTLLGTRRAPQWKAT